MSKIANKQFLSRIYYSQLCKYASTKSGISITNKTAQKTIAVTYDEIGLPDKHSNLRPVKFYVPPQESALEKRYRELRLEAQEWNQKFWSEHNQRFIKEREKFIAANKTEGESALNADKMSVFYKEFLDGNWKSHVAYNVAWYQRNLKILSLAVKVQIDNMWNKIKR